MAVLLAVAVWVPIMTAMVEGLRAQVMVAVELVSSVAQASERLVLATVALPAASSAAPARAQAALA